MFPWASSPIVHDYLYWTQTTTRPIADTILKNAMQDSGVGRAKIGIIVGAVKAEGQSAWDENRKLKQFGEKRLLKEFPSDAFVSWEDWKKSPTHFAD